MSTFHALVSPCISIFTEVAAASAVVRGGVVAGGLVSSYIPTSDESKWQFPPASAGRLQMASAAAATKVCCASSTAVNLMKVGR